MIAGGEKRKYIHARRVCESRAVCGIGSSWLRQKMQLQEGESALVAEESLGGGSGWIGEMWIVKTLIIQARR